MSDTYIIIKGEEAEIFAQKLLEIPGISLPKGTQQGGYKSGTGESAKIILLTVAPWLISQGIIAVGTRIVNEYKNLPTTSKIEEKIDIIEPDKDIYTIDLCSPIYNQNTVENLPQEDSLNDSPPSLNPLPSLEEIAKLSIEERHELLSPYMENMAEIFNNDPDLVNCWDIDGDE